MSMDLFDSHTRRRKHARRNRLASRDRLVRTNQRVSSPSQLLARQEKMGLNVSFLSQASSRFDPSFGMFTPLFSIDRSHETK